MPWKLPSNESGTLNLPPTNKHCPYVAAAKIIPFAIAAGVPGTEENCPVLFVQSASEPIDFRPPEEYASENDPATSNNP